MSTDIARRTVTRRTRNVGFAWSNAPVQTAGGLVIPRPRRPEVVGTVRQVMAEFDRAARINSGGTSWRWELFVGGRRVLSDRPMDDVWLLCARGERAGEFLSDSVTWDVEADD